MTTADPGRAPARPAPQGTPAPGAGLRLGLRANLAQFCLLVAVAMTSAKYPGERWRMPVRRRVGAGFRCARRMSAGGMGTTIS